MHEEDPVVLVVERVMLEGLHETDKPVDGVTELVTFSVPWKPLSPVAVNVAEPDEPELKLRVEGLAATAKSGGWTFETITLRYTMRLRPAPPAATDTL